MNILPHEEFELRSPLSQEEILKRMTVSTMYKGKATDNTFEVQRIIKYRNSFLPQIKGVIESEYKGSKILVTMKLHKFVAVFMAIWIVLLTIFSFIFYTAVDIDSPSDTFFPASIFKYMPLIMIVFGFALTYFSFKIESKISRKDLKNILEGEETYNKVD